jgi:hypothetical protein
MNSDPSKITEDMAWQEIRQGTYRVDLWERQDVGRLLAGHIRQALADDAPRRADFKSARDLERKT